MAGKNDRFKTVLIVVAAAAFAGIGVWIAAQRLAAPIMTSDGEPFAYDLDAAGRIDPSLISWDEKETIPLAFDDPRGLALAADDTVYVVGDTDLVKIAADGAVLTSRKLGSEPYCVALADDGSIFIGMWDHVEMLSPGAEGTVAWAGLGDRATLTSVAVTGAGVVVADAGNRQVIRYDRSGTMLGRIGGPGAAEGTFIVPSPFFDLAAGLDGGFWVVDPGRHAFREYAETGELVSEWAKSSMGIDGFCGCCNPSHIAIAADGAFVTSEKGFVRVKIHEASGALRSVVAGPDSFDEGTVGLDLAVDSRGRVVLLDPKRRQIRIFEERDQ